MKRMRRIWSYDEDSIIHSNYKSMSDSQLATILGRCKKSVTARRIRFGLRKRKSVIKMNEDEKAFIVRNGPYASNYKIAKILNRSESTIRQFRNTEGTHYKLTG